MSYSGYVICNCYKDGKTKEPPHKEFLRVNEEGIYLDIPDELWEKDEEKVNQMEKDFDEWERTACEHVEMKLAKEYLSNISGMIAFKIIVKELVGQDKFPILTEYLPTANDGFLPSEFAQQALEELLRIENEQTTEEKIVLIEKSTGSLKASINADTYCFFVFTAYSKNIYGIDKDGFFILEKVKEKNEELSYIMFRSNNFIQQTISKDHYKFIDIPSGESYDCTAKLHPLEEEATDVYEFEVQIERVVIANQYKYMIEPLKRLAKMSILSGNPINWA